MTDNEFLEFVYFTIRHKVFILFMNKQVARQIILIFLDSEKL